jgi:superfamily II DNA/RNA helicase
MLDMGFLPDLQRIINLLPKQRQNLMFSATFSPEIKKLASSFLNNPVTIEVARSNATAERVTQTIYKVNEDAKSDAVAHIIRERQLKQVIVFSNTKIGASKLARQLENDGVKASAIHGDKSQGERMAALEAFKQGQVEVLVATDVAARGLDITDLPCVINIDLPYNAEDYVHRIGRTGRAGASGDAISLFSDKDERLLVDIEKLIKIKFVRAELAGFVPRQRSERGERTERGERSERSSSRGERTERGDRGERSSSASGSSPERDGERSSVRRDTQSYGRSGGGGARREKVDPWFLKPYEPTAAPAPIDASVNAAKPASKPSKHKVAALLGGMPKR